MGWLEAHADRINKEKLNKEEIEAKNRLSHQNRWDQRDKEGKEWVSSRLKELIGKPTALGPINLEHKYCHETIRAGENELAVIQFYVTEKQSHDGDGCYYGIGEYYNTMSLALCKEWKDANGNKKHPSHHEHQCDEILAEYLLYFLNNEKDGQPY